jgi:hypothetical protein
MYLSPADQNNIPRGELRTMTPKSIRLLSETEGKGIIGCMLSIVLMAMVLFLGITLGPIYYNKLNLESDLKTEVSRAGARYLDNEIVIKDVIDLARRSDIKITRENVKVERFAGQVHIRVNYSVPADLLVMDQDFNFEIKVSSFTGAL